MAERIPIVPVGWEIIINCNYERLLVFEKSHDIDTRFDVLDTSRMEDLFDQMWLGVSDHSEGREVITVTKSSLLDIASSDVLIKDSHSRISWS